MILLAQADNAASGLLTQVVTPEVLTPSIVTPVVTVQPVVLSEGAATFTHYITWPVATMLVVLLFAGLLLWNAQHSVNRIDFKDLVLDFDVNRVSLSKFTTLGCFLITSWLLIAKTVAGTVTEGDVLVYVGAWASVGLGVQYIKTKAQEANAKVITAENGP